MHDAFLLDLRAARRKAGLTQGDVGHLLGKTIGVVSNIEAGARPPNLQEMMAFSLIFGKSFESYFGPVIDDVRADIAARLQTLPPARETVAQTFNRGHSLKAMRHRLEANNDERYGF